MTYWVRSIEHGFEPDNTVLEFVLIDISKASRFVAFHDGKSRVIRAIFEDHAIDIHDIVDPIAYDCAMQWVEGLPISD